MIKNISSRSSFHVHVFIIGFWKFRRAYEVLVFFPTLSRLLNASLLTGFGFLAHLIALNFVTAKKFLQLYRFYIENRFLRAEFSRNAFAHNAPDSYLRPISNEYSDVQKS